MRAVLVTVQLGWVNFTNFSHFFWNSHFFEIANREVIDVVEVQYRTEQE